MIYIFFGIILILLLYRIQIKPKNGEKFMIDYMSVEKTMSIKGIFIIVVFFSHFNSYVKFTDPLDISYAEIFSNTGQAMVTLFLFYSGYGVMESFKSKGMGYVHRMPLTRILGTYFRFGIAVLMFVVLQAIRGFRYSASKYILSFLGWDAVGNSNWYIFVVVVAYLISFVAFEIFRDKGRYFPSAVLITVLCCTYIALFYCFEVKPDYWIDTLICYSMGIWFSLTRKYIEKIVMKNLFVYSFFLVGTAVAMQYFYMERNNSFMLQEHYIVFFTLFFVILSMRVSFHNKILMWFGKNLFGLYIMQRIPMIIFRHFGIDLINIYVYFILCVIVTIPLGWAFEKCTGKLWKFITAPKKKTA